MSLKLKVLEKERQIFKRINDYNKKFNDKMKRNYFFDSDNNLKKQKEQINREINVDELNDVEIINFYQKCNEKKLAKICRQKVLMLELENFRPINLIKNMPINNFKNEAMGILFKYQHKAGGKLLENIDWVCYSHGNKMNNVMENELLLENSLSKCDEEDDDTFYYLELLVNRLNLISSNIDCELRYNDRNSVILIWIWCTDTN
jgi:hypothetical protein